MGLHGKPGLTGLTYQFDLITLGKQISNSIQTAAREGVRKKCAISSPMNLGFNSHLRGGLYFFLVSPSVWLRVLEGKQNKTKKPTVSSLLPYQMRPRAEILCWLLEGFICPSQALALCKLLSDSSLPCKDFRERSKNTSKGTILFSPGYYLQKTFSLYGHGQKANDCPEKLWKQKYPFTSLHRNAI